MKCKYCDGTGEHINDANRMTTCEFCGGTGIYNVPIFDDNGEWTDKWEFCHCEVCGGTGKITLARYEELQKGMRGDKE